MIGKEKRRTMTAPIWWLTVGLVGLLVILALVTLYGDPLFRV
jgi:hypothetical protein